MPRIPFAKKEEIVLIRSTKVHPFNSRQSIHPSRLYMLAPMIGKSKEIIEDLRSFNVKGKRPMSLEEQYASKKLIRSIGI